MHLYYPTLNKDQTKSIWRMNLDRTIKRKGGMMKFDESGIMAYAEQHFEYHQKKNTRWNGRQIHNAFRTATALAEYEALEGYEEQPITARLEVEHFKIVSEASHLFDSYITETIGGTDAERALNDRDRADNFKFAPVQEQDFYLPRQPAFQPSQYTFAQQQPQFSRTEFEAFQQQQHLGRLDPQSTPPLSAQSRTFQSWQRPPNEGSNDMYAQSHDFQPPWASSFPQRRADIPPDFPGYQMGPRGAASSSAQAPSKAALSADDGY
jgi:hypothetical protein